MGAASVAARRAGAAMVRANGTAVRLEIPAPPVAGDDGEGMGLRTPQFAARMVSPAAVRVVKDSVELLVAADVLESALGVHAFGAVRAVMATVCTVVVGDVRYRVVNTECVHAAGEPCLYRLVCAGDGMEVV